MWRGCGRSLRSFGAALLVCILFQEQGWAWGADGHRMINRLAAANLPADVPAFLRNGEALDTLEYLGPEPDRWRNKAEPELVATQAPDHFIDLEWADLAGQLPRERYDYIRSLAAAQLKHPEMTLTPEKVGLQPYTTVEAWERLKVGLREYRKLLAANADTRPAETAVLVYAGILGHYVADGSQPMHATYQYNGWTGPNPRGYTTEHKIHALFESTFVTANIKPADIEPLVKAQQPKVLNDVFDDYVAYLRHSNTLVEKTYQLEKAGGFEGAGTREGKSFAEERLSSGATELRDLIYTAWLRSADPVQEYHGS